MTEQHVWKRERRGKIKWRGGTAISKEGYCRWRPLSLRRLSRMRRSAQRHTNCQSKQSDAN
ncbi:hypothetical protein RMSM_03944 [Rhodopirellula maiorica SM1]|uniref:Uncharacterized protein n=1 Tax=Rhodopirellula maiorica SM1 TaxID=1265738 RepID=M5RIV0_9BACT|nr:hypothetical protein RMSM_03944 [Rhodopirellula maiorica SM1]